MRLNTNKTNFRRFSIYSKMCCLFIMALLIGFPSLIFKNTSFSQSMKVSAEEHFQINVPKNKTSQMHNLNGEKAEEYLKDNGLYNSLGEAMQAARYSINWIENSPVSVNKGAFEANNPNNNYTAYFQDDSVHLVSKNKDDDWRLQMKLKGFGYGEDISSIKTEKSEIQKDKTRIEINKSTINNSQSEIVEWYENKKEGLEQGWTLNERPNNHTAEKPLKLELEIGGNLKPKLADDKQSLLLSKKNGSGTIRYEKLQAWDINGKDVPTKIELVGNKLTLLTEEKDAVYPLTIDPVFSFAKTLSAFDGTNNDAFGDDVAIDGDTIVIGAPQENNFQGSAYIFSRNENGADNWGLVKKLVASDGATFDIFGGSVAISGDRIVIGAELDDIGAGSNQGSIYVLERNQGGIDNWGEVKKISASDGTNGERFGTNISIYQDTIVVGLQLDEIGGNLDQGSAYIYERNQGGVNNWGEVKKIMSSDGASTDSFGYSVSIDKDTIIIGAPGDDIVTDLSRGSAYVFKKNQGGANNWGQVIKILATDGETNDNFGIDVSISNDTIVVGASFGGTSTNTSAGAAYIFERNQLGVDNWGFVKKLVASDGVNDDRFGESVAIDNDTVIIAAHIRSPSGATYVYSRNQGGADNWSEVKKLTQSNPQSSDSFGSSVDISGNTVVVGDKSDSINNDSNREGSAHIFRTDTVNWLEAKQQTSSDGTDFDQFGNSVAISGDTMIVGASNDGVNLNPFQGSAYIFYRNQGGADNWGEIAKITALDGAINDEFGHSVAICGDTVIVGAYKHTVGGSNTAQGAAYIFERNQGGADNWGQVRKLTSLTGTTGDEFGVSVSISGDTAIVGANRDEISSQTAQGSANIFNRNQNGANNWGEVKKLIASDGTGGDQFGTSVSISGDTVIVGAPLKDVGTNLSAGAAYIFERNQGGTADNWGEVKKIIDSPVQASSIFGQSVAIDNDTVIIGSPQYDTFTQQNVGSASIFERNTGGADNWGFVDFVLASDRNNDDEFGTSVSIDIDQVIVGSPFADVNSNNNQGAAYIFERNRDGVDAWGEFKKLTASTGSGFDQFGISVAINRNQVAIGANRTDISSPFSQPTGKSAKTSLAGSDQGAAFVFRANPFAPTAAGATVGGRVLNSTGNRGVPRAIVTLTDQSGELKTARSNQFGYYRFEDIEVGQIYILNVSSKGYIFPTKVINITDNVSNLDIRAIAPNTNTPGKTKTETITDQSIISNKKGELR